MNTKIDQHTLDINVSIYEAFTSQAGKGNPAGIVFEADHLTEDEMQNIAKKVGLNETAFILKSLHADLRIRYFTPGHEVNLCGHATIASIYALMKRNNLSNSCELNIETLAGILPVYYDQEKQEVKMTQAPAHFLPFEGDINKLTSVIGIQPQDISDSLPIVYGNTGIWTLIIPIKSLEVFHRMHPQTHLFHNVLSQIPGSSIHPFCLETYDNSCSMHGRHFSGSFSGTVEDPVTGTASGVMGAYHIKYIHPTNNAEFLVEQGTEIGRNGFVRVFATKDDSKINISIAGKAVYVSDIMIKL